LETNKILVCFKKGSDYADVRDCISG